MSDIDFAAYMEPVARALLGESTSKNGHEWRYGAHGSISVDLKRGTWYDFETRH